MGSIIVNTSRQETGGWYLFSAAGGLELLFESWYSPHQRIWHRQPGIKSVPLS
jgi:hypothetical protein